MPSCSRSGRPSLPKPLLLPLLYTELLRLSMSFAEALLSCSVSRGLLHIPGIMERCISCAAGNPYQDSNGVFGDNQFRYALLSLAACEAPLQLNVGGYRWLPDHLTPLHPAVSLRS